MIWNSSVALIIARLLSRIALNAINSAARATTNAPTDKNVPHDDCDVQVCAIQGADVAAIVAAANAKNLIFLDII